MKVKRVKYVRVMVSEAEKAKYQIAADNCCEGNLSDFFRKSADGGHAARMIHGKQLENLISQAVKQGMSK